MKIIFLGKCINAAKEIILIPKTQITRNPTVLKPGSKYQAKLTITSSTNTNQRPRFTKKTDNSFRDFLLPTIKAESPARKLNAGAQKWVMNLVKKMGTVVSVGSVGLKK